MPRPRKNLDRFRDEIERRIADTQTQDQILSWLATQGVNVSKIPSPLFTSLGV